MSRTVKTGAAWYVKDLPNYSILLLIELAETGKVTTWFGRTFKTLEDYHNYCLRKHRTDVGSPDSSCPKSHNSWNETRNRKWAKAKAARLNRRVAARHIRKELDDLNS